LPETKKSSKRISPKRLQDLKVVVLCIAAATTFWILNALNKDNYNTIVDYPIAWTYDHKNHVAVSPLPESIQIQITGNGWDLLRKYFKLNEPPFDISLANPSGRGYILTSDLKRSLGEFLTPTQLIGILEDSVFYQIDKIQTRQLEPFLDSASFSLAKNHEIDGKILFDPTRITITGPESILDSFEGKFPVYLKQEKIDKSLVKSVPLTLDKSNAEFLTLMEENIQVSFDVIAFWKEISGLKSKN
jgi:YbbR domain-containing protein